MHIGEPRKVIEVEPLPAPLALPYEDVPDDRPVPVVVPV